jgi:hypothetical protein
MIPNFAGCGVAPTSNDGRRHALPLIKGIAGIKKWVQKDNWIKVESHIGRF